ncbi:MAG: HlyC/CorC family transporter [Lachnospiraceae bacterium]|nr:HlyC/CorC family transporter [Lachnospiraceae bacterium]
MSPELLALIFVGAGIVISIIFSAFFSGSEMAFSACNQVRLENESKEGKKGAKTALKLAENYDDTLSTILVGNNLVNVAATTLTAVFVILASGNDSLNWLGTIVITVLVIIFGETVPKIACKKMATSKAVAYAGLLAFFRILFMPVTFPVVKLVGLLTKPIRESEPEDPEEESQAELQQIIETAEDEGVLDPDRTELVSAAIDFSDISADEVMTARVDLEALDIDEDREELIRYAIESSHSRMPVYEGSIDHIIGVVHLNWLLKALSEDQNADIRALMKEPLFIYRTTKLPQVLDTLKKARQHLAVVVDEYSGTLGVVTMEDVLEEIVGDIWDETDEVEEEVVEREDGGLEIDGDMNVDDFLELLGEHPENFDFESGTVGGLIIEKNGDFPAVGDTVEFEDLFTAKVLEMEGLRVVKVLVTPKEKKPEEE